MLTVRQRLVIDLYNSLIQHALHYLCWLFLTKACNEATVIELLLNHSRSSKVTPFDSLHMVSYYRPIVTLCLKCTVFEIWRHISRKSPKKPNPPHLARSFGGPLANFLTSHTFPETRVIGLSDGVHFTILLSLCYAQYWRVTDGRTDGHVAVAKTRASIESRG